MSETMKSAGKLLDKASEKMGEMVSDDVMASAIIRAVNKQKRVNEHLEEKGCDHRIRGFEIDHRIPPGVIFYVAEKPDGSEESG